MTELRSAQTILQNHDLGHDERDVGDSIRCEEAVKQGNGLCRRASRAKVRISRFRCRVPAAKAIECHRVIDCRADADDHGEHRHQEEQELAGFEEISGRFGPFDGYSVGIVEVAAQQNYGNAIKENESDERRFANSNCVVRGNVIIGSAATVVAEQMTEL